MLLVCQSCVLYVVVCTRMLLVHYSIFLFNLGSYNTHCYHILQENGTDIYLKTGPVSLLNSTFDVTYHKILW